MDKIRKITPEDLVDSKTPPRKCPNCERELDRAAGTGTPGPGCFSICAYCYSYLMFDKDLNLIFLPDKVWMNLSSSDRIYMTQLREMAKSINEGRK